MNNKWTEHIKAWERFLYEYLKSLSDPGEIIKIERQLRTLERARCGAVLNPSLMSSFLGSKSTGSDTKVEIGQTHFALNQSQLEAVNQALSSSTLSLIKGPPGTGKTQVISEICLQLFDKNPTIRILVCSETHVAVNNLLSRIAQKNSLMRIVRIRDKEGDNQVNAFSPETIGKSFLEWAKRAYYSYDYYQIVESEMINAIDSDDKSFEKALSLSANVIGLTCNRLSSYDFRDRTEMFDVAIIDEVCKATLPEIIAPLLVSQKAILLGDPKQLPPLFCSEEYEIIRNIENCNLDRYMYIDELFDTSATSVTLDTQYRMSTDICNMISNVFYSGRLKDGRKTSIPSSLRWVTYEPSKDWPIDDRNSNANKLQIYNDDECQIIKALINEINGTVNDIGTIAVISPYRAQIKRLRECIGFIDNTIIDTVDGFQGKEADVVIFSMTRTMGSYRFLSDPRRLNVALSRARDKVIIVGEIEYCKRNLLLNSIINCFEIEKTTVNS